MNNERVRLVPFFCRWIKDISPKPRSILDIGAGYLGPHFKLEFGKAYKSLELEGAEIDCDYLGTAEAIPVDDNKVEIVTGFSVIEHIPNPYNGLLEMGRVSKKAILLTTDLTDADKNRDPEHLYAWTPKVFRQLLEYAGEELGYKAYVSTPQSPAMIVGILRK